MENNNLNKIVLVVEDDVLLKKALVLQLKKSGFSVLEAGDGEEGLAIAVKHHPDLILLDVMMPKMDGITMLTKLRNDSWGKGAEAIIFTNLAVDSGIIKKIEETYPSHYFMKPDWEVRDLVLKAKQTLGIS